MKWIWLFLVFVSLASAQNSKLAISPAVDRNNKFNQEAFQVLGEFLSGSNDNHWLQSDFEKGFPYADIVDIRKGRQGDVFYRPTLMELINTADSEKKIAKISFIGHDPKTGDNFLKAIYNIVVTKNDDRIVLSRYLDYATRDWEVVKSGQISYRISPNRKFSKADADKQQGDIVQLSSFFGIEEFPIDYYSCVSPKEVFEIRGFDYHPMMYVDESGGLAEDINTIFSGNDSESYTHEIVHLYVRKKFPKIHPFWNEGIATYLGGSGKFEYAWQKAQFKKFLEMSPEFDCGKHTDPFERFYFEKETPIPYMIAAVLCERIIRLHGKDRLFEIMASGLPPDAVNSIEVAIGKLDDAIRDELNR